MANPNQNEAVALFLSRDSAVSNFHFDYVWGTFIRQNGVTFNFLDADDMHHHGFAPGTNLYAVAASQADPVYIYADTSGYYAMPATAGFSNKVKFTMP